MDKQSKQGGTTGKSQSSKTGSGSTASAHQTTTQSFTVTRVLPVSNSAPILEGSKRILENKEPDFLTIKILAGDFQAVAKMHPQSYVGSKDGKIVFCIDPGTTGKYAVVNGEIYWNGVKVDVLLEKHILERSKK